MCTRNVFHRLFHLVLNKTWHVCCWIGLLFMSNSTVASSEWRSVSYYPILLFLEYFIADKHQVKWERRKQVFITRSFAKHDLNLSPNYNPWVSKVCRAWHSLLHHVELYWWYATPISLPIVTICENSLHLSLFITSGFAVWTFKVCELEVIGLPWTLQSDSGLWWWYIVSWEPEGHKCCSKMFH